MSLALSKERATSVVYFVFLAMMAVVAIMAVFGHRAIAPCFLAMGLVVAFRPAVWRYGKTSLSRGVARKDTGSIALIAAVAFSVWIAIASYWSPVDGTIKLFINTLAPVLAGYAVVWQVSTFNENRQIAVGKAFLLMVVGAAILLAIEALSGGALRNFVPPADQSPERFKDMTALGRGVTVLTLALFPAIVLAKRLSGHWWLGGALIICTFLAAVHFTISSNLLALCVGAVIFGVALLWPRSTLRTVVLGALVILLLTPAFVFLPSETLINFLGERVSASWLQRLAIWEASGTAVLECFPFGCGPDYSRAMKNEWAMITVPGSSIPLRTMPTHPHNLFMQIWLELGGVGVALVVFGLSNALKAFLSIKEMPPIVVAGAAALVSAIVASALVEMSLWQVWRLSSIGLGIFGVSVSYFVCRQSFIRVD